MSVYEMDPRVKLRDIFKTKKHIELRLMALGEKITENFSLTVLVCITKINLHYRSLAVLTENGFSKLFSIQVSLPDRPVVLSHFWRLICARVI